MKVLITGARGFVGKNLQLHLAERKDVQVVCFTRGDGVEQLPTLLQGVDFVFHLAGVNRPQDPQEFATGNAELAQSLCRAVCAVAESTGRKVPVVYTSSTQAGFDNPYGRSKRGAEEALQAAARSHGIPVHLFRLPNVFGKWCRPNYNSAVATFCHNISRGLPIQVNDPAAPVTLVYVDDVIERFVQLMDGADAVVNTDGFATVAPQYATTVGELARQIQSFRDSRSTGTRAVCSSRCSRRRTPASSRFLPRTRASRGAATTTTARPRSSWSSRGRRASSSGTCTPAKPMSW